MTKKFLLKILKIFKNFGSSFHIKIVFNTLIEDIRRR